MTLAEFLHEIKKGKQSDVVLATLYYFKHYKDQPQMSAADIKARMKRAKVPKAGSMNVNAIINSSAPYIDNTDSKENGVFLFEITGTGEQHIRGLSNLPTIEPLLQHDVRSLQGVLNNVSNPVVREYVQEAITCLSVGALRASVVFLWSGAIRTLQEDALKKSGRQLNPTLQKHDGKARKVSRVQDFAYIKDKTLLLACSDLGLIDKGQRTILEADLDLRNLCSHPSKYVPGKNKVASFIEELCNVVWT